MTVRNKLLVGLAAFALLGSPTFAGPGGNGGGNGNGASNGNGGNSASAGSQSSGSHSQGQGQATSVAAKDPATRGLEKALNVVGTTPASPQATFSLRAAFDSFLGRNSDAEPGD